MPFQTAVLQEPAPGLEGGWASNNVFTSMVNPNNGDPTIGAYTSWQAGPAGLTAGRFVFCDTTTGLVYPGHPGTATIRIGFLHRYQIALINAYLGQSGSFINPGQEVDPVDGGDFWVRTPGAITTTGLKLFASYADGTVSTGAAGSTPTGAAVTGNTTNGSPGLTNLSAPLAVGTPVAGTGIPAGTYIVAAPTATTATMSANATATGTTVSITPTTSIETRWYADTIAPANGLTKMSTRG